MTTHTQTKDLDTTWAINSSYDIWTLAKQATITVSEQPAILLSPMLDGNTVNINGDILASKIENAIDIEAQGTKLNIGAASEITNKDDYAIRVRTEGVEVVNAGKVTAASSAFYSDSNGILVNSGTMKADATVYSEMAVNVDNSGTLFGNNATILALAKDTVIVNRAGGVIQATGESAMHLYQDGTYTVKNFGSILSNSAAIYDDTANARIINHGTIKGSVTLGAGDDFFDTRGGVVKGRIEGGDGNDTYIVDSQSFKIVEKANEGADTVKSTVDYTLGANIDKLILLGKADIDATGNGLAANILLGNAGSNIIKGLGGADYMSGGGGADQLFGGAGADRFGLRQGDDHDKVMDFVDGQDQIITAYAQNQDEVKALLADHLSETAAGVTIDYGADTLFIKGLTKEQLTVDDFFY